MLEISVYCFHGNRDLYQEVKMHFWTVILENDKRKEEDEQQPVPDGVRVESTPRWENLVFPLIVNVFCPVSPLRKSR
jgi:hypothetical protein